VARILVIDDERQVRDMLEEMLRSAGHVVVMASDGEEALEVQRQSRCDLVIADLFMPGRQGLDVIRELRERDPDLKILALSGGGGFARFDALESAVEAGASLTMRKPVDWEELVLTIGNLLQTS
jgi:DNA-binding response OmpR family regulator